ncbi:MAG TPA: NAD-dependent protein deacylase [Ruminococcaceae bacterium]|nr:NAD-dependent protein deacylase [Oscillospiraceae bacterium]
MSDAVRKLAEYIRGSDNIVFFGGAGVSTESGVPDFRSKDGLYNRPNVGFENYTPEYLLSHDCLTEHPEVFFEFYRQKMDTRNAEPNAAHHFLSDLERIGKLKAIVTQNIDGLHQRAGSINVFEIHGTTRRNYCSRCGKRYPADYIFTSAESIPHCTCGGIVRCDVTLYGEQLPEREVEGAIRAISGADMLIIGGTSLTVYPAASYVRYFRGQHLAIINRDPIGIPLRPDRDIEINDSIGKTFSAVREYL